MLESLVTVAVTDQTTELALMVLTSISERMNTLAPFMAQTRLLSQLILCTRSGEEE